MRCSPARSAHFAVARVACGGSGGEEQMDAERQWVLQLARDPQARARDDRTHGAAIQSLQVADLGSVLALGGAPRGQVGLQRHLHHHRAGRRAPPRPGARPGRARARARGRRRPARRRPRPRAGVNRRRARPSRSRAARARSSTAASVISTPASRPPKPRAVQLAQQRPVAAADLQGIDWMPARPQARAGAQREHVVGLADRPERAPARVQRRLGRIVCV